MLYKYSLFTYLASLETFIHLLDFKVNFSVFEQNLAAHQTLSSFFTPNNLRGLEVKEEKGVLKYK